MRVRRSIGEPARSGLSNEQLWLGDDWGLIASWERGREVAAERPDLAKQARDGALVMLPWRGGVDRKLKAGRKFGSVRYLAMWQGLRGEDLDVDLYGEMSRRCSLHGVTVTFTADQSKFAEQDEPTGD